MRRTLCTGVAVIVAWGGLVAATLLTLVFLPALYVAWFRIEPVSERQPIIPAGAHALAHG